MAHNDLRDWIKVLEKAGELKRIREEVDPVLEIAEITDRVSKIGRRVATQTPSGKYAPGGPALLFENVKGYPRGSVLMNQFGSERRMKLALGVDSLDEIAGRIREFLEVKSPEGVLEKLKMLPMLAEVGKFFPRTIAARDAKCKEVVLRDNFSVLDFPVLQCWPADGGRFITLPGVSLATPNRQAQHGHVPDAGLRRPDHRHALAAAEERRRTSSRAPAGCCRERGAESRGGGAGRIAMAETAARSAESYARQAQGPAA